MRRVGWVLLCDYCFSIHRRREENTPFRDCQRSLSRNPTAMALWRNSIEIAASGQAAEVLLLIQEAIA